MSSPKYNKAQYQKAVEIVGKLPKTGPVTPDNDAKLDFYACFKQAELGNVNTARPGIFDMVGKAKWDAWNALKVDDKDLEASKEKAMSTYVEKLLKILNDALANDKIDDKTKADLQLQKYVDEITALA
ncbi:acyl-CoA-binding protein 3 [Mycena epipterygia]|nr:acyl-CoA-binding protein 3 [Mycena epipterygia]